MSISSIEWTEQTWNPIVGCSLKSPGCTNCYAMGMAARIEAMNAAARPGHETAPHYAGTTKKVNGRAVWTGKIAFASDEVLLAPLRRKKPTVYFVNSMGDLFHEDCPDDWIDRVFAMMWLARQHTYQVLTKRAEGMKAYFATPGRLNQINGAVWSLLGTPIGSKIEHGGKWSAPALPLGNVWLGVSAERQQEWDERKEHLRATLAAVRFASFEPLLGNIIEPRPMSDFIQWAIVGGESGPNARPMHPDWPESLRDQCAAADVKFFFKQWGRWSPTHPDFPLAVPYAVANDGTAYFSPDLAYPDGKRYGEALRAGHDKAHLTSMYPIGKAKSGKLLDGIEHQAMPEIRRPAP